MKDFDNFEYILEDWLSVVNEYSKLLKRYGLTTIIIVTHVNNDGMGMAKLFANQDEYLMLATENTHFIAEEKQIMELLNHIKSLYEVATMTFDDAEEDYINFEVDDIDDADDIYL